MSHNEKGLFAWALYDFGNSAFSALIQTFIFAAYFTQKISVDPVEGAALWGGINAIAALTIGITGPLLGSIADHGGNRKYWIGTFTFVCVTATALLWFATPHPDSLPFASICVGIAIISSEIAFIFYNAMLPDLAPPAKIGRWSGWGWGLGYLGGMICLIVALYFFILPQHDNSESESVRATFLLCAAWYLVFSLPLFLFTPSTHGKRFPAIKAIKAGLKELKGTLLEIKKYKDIVKFLIARLFYIDGLTTLFVFGGVFGAEVFGMNQAQIIIFGILLHISAGIGAGIFSWLDDLLGAKKVILISLAGLAIPTVCLLLTHSIELFWFYGFIIGIFVGPVQSASRSLMARLSPPYLRNEMFGFFALSGKGTTFLGPILTGWILVATGSHRIGLSVVCMLFVIGGIMISTVKEPEIPRESS